MDPMGLVNGNKTNIENSTRNPWDPLRTIEVESMKQWQRQQRPVCKRPVCQVANDQNLWRFQQCKQFYYSNHQKRKVVLSYPDSPWCWNIYLHNWAIFRVNVGKYSSTMEHLGSAQWRIWSRMTSHHTPDIWRFPFRHRATPLLSSSIIFGKVSTQNGGYPNWSSSSSSSSSSSIIQNSSIDGDGNHDS